MKKILIIEDDAFLKNMESSKFTHEGYDVATAMTQPEIDAALAKGTPDIVLLDMMLPGLDSMVVLKALKADAKTAKTPVIVFSNVAEDAEMKKALDSGANDYMVKANFTLDEVIEKIKTLTK
jgi:DNA-binding response OmpR family regulator